MAGNKIAECFVAVSAEMGGLSAGLRQSQSMVTASVGQMQNSLGQLRGTIGSLLGLAGFSLSAAGIYQIGKNLLFAGDAAAKLKNSFTVLLEGNEQKADKLIGKMREFTALTPFSEQQVSSAVTALLPFEKEIDKVFEMLTSLGDAASVSADGLSSFPRVTRAITQMMGKNKISAEEMMQLAEAGIPAWKSLATAIGKSVAETQELSRKGKLGGESIHKFIAQLGKDFAGSMEKQSQTIEGLLSTISDNIKVRSVKAFQPIYEAAQAAFSKVAGYVQSTEFSGMMDNIAVGVLTATSAIKGFVSTLVQLNDATGGVAGIMVALTSSISVAVPIATKLFSIFKVGSMVAALGPVLPIALAVAGAISAIIGAWKLAMQSSQAEGILAGLKDIWANVQMLWTNVKSAADGIWQAISSAFGLATGSVAEAMGSAVASVVGFFQEVTYWLGAFSSNWPATWEIIKESSSIAMEWIGNLFGALADRWQTVLAAIVDISLVTWTSIAAALGAAFGAVNWGALGEAFGNLMKTWAAHSWGMIGGFSGVFTWLMDSWKDVLTRMLSAWQSYSMALPKALYAAIKSLASGGTIGDAFSAAISEGMKGVGDAMKGFGEVGAEAAGKFADGYSGAFGEAKEALGITQGIGESLASIGDEAGKAASAAADAAMANVAAKMDRLKGEMAALADAANTPELQARREALAKQIGDLASEYDKQKAVKAAKAAKETKAEGKPESKLATAKGEEPVAGKAKDPFIGFADLNRKMQEAMLKDTIGKEQLDVAEEQLEVQKEIRDKGDESAFQETIGQGKSPGVIQPPSLDVWKDYAARIGKNDEGMGQYMAAPVIGQNGKKTSPLDVWKDYAARIGKNDEGMGQYMADQAKVTPDKFATMEGVKSEIEAFERTFAERKEAGSELAGKNIDITRQMLGEMEAPPPIVAPKKSEPGNIPPWLDSLLSAPKPEPMSFEEIMRQNFPNSREAIASRASERGGDILASMLRKTQTPSANGPGETTEVASNTAEANTLLGKLLAAMSEVAKKLEPKTKPIVAGA